MIYGKLMLRKLDTRLTNFAKPFLETLRPCKTPDIVVGIGFFLIAFLCYASVCTETLSGGDPAVYIQQMKNLDFSKRSVHVGYYLLGAGFIRLLPGSDDYVANLMNCFFGALSVTTVYWIAFVICQKRLIAILSGLLLLTHYIFLENSVYAEVYTPRTCFLLLAFLLWLLDRPVFAALSLAFSLLIATSTVFALPLFFLLRPRFGRFLLFFLIILAVALGAIIPVHKDYFFGGRGLFTIALHQAFDLGFVLQREGREVLLGFLLSIPLLVVGVVGLFVQKRFRPLGFGLLSLWGFSLFLGEKNWNDFPVQLPTYALLCLVGGLGIHSLLRFARQRRLGTVLSGIMLIGLMTWAILIKTAKSPAQVSGVVPTWFLAAMVFCGLLCLLVSTLPKFRPANAHILTVGVALFAVVFSGFVAFSRILMLNKYHVGYRNSVMQVSKVTGPPYILVGHWSQYMLFEHYVFEDSYTPNCTYINIRSFVGARGKESEEAAAKLNEAVAARRKIVVLGNHTGLITALRQSGYNISKFGYIYLAGPSQGTYQIPRRQTPST